MHNFLYQNDCNPLHNIFKLFGVLPNFPFTATETMGNYYSLTWYIRVAKRLKTEEIRNLENIRKMSKFHRMIAYCPVFLPK